jgi:hypothetical protein
MCRPITSFPQLPAELLLQVGRGREVIGVRVGFEQPVDLEAGLTHVGDDRVGERGRGTARGLVEIEHRVDDRGAPGDGIVHHVARGEGRFMEEAAHDGRNQLAATGLLDLLGSLFEMGVGLHLRGSF